MSDSTKLLVGLGNPGPDYELTRHNVGAWLLEKLAEQQHVTFKSDTKFFGKTARTTIGKTPCHLLLPTTFMNHSGRAVRAMSDYYKISPTSIIIIHDDLDLPAGVARWKQAGGHGGHNGLRDIIKAVDSQDFIRLRLGIGHPGQSDQVLDYVLGRPSKQAYGDIQLAIDHALMTVDWVVQDHLEKAMQHLHTEG